MALPTVAIDLAGWLAHVAFPFSQKAISGAGAGAWLQTHTHYTPLGKTVHTLVQTPHHQSWDLERAPRSRTGHEALCVLAHKTAFFEGWDALTDALHARYRIEKAGMSLKILEGEPRVDAWANIDIEGAPLVVARLYQGPYIVASLDELLDVFAALGASGNPA